MPFHWLLSPNANLVGLFKTELTVKIVFNARILADGQ